MALIAVAAILAVAGAAARPGTAATPTAVVPTDLLAQATANPTQTFSVIVQASHGNSAGQVAKAISDAQGLNPSLAKGLKRQFSSIAGASAALSGAQLVALAADPKVGVITPDGRTGASWSNAQVWPDVSQSSAFWARGSAASSPLQAGTIAFIDSGIDASHAAFGGRVLTQVNLYSGANVNSSGDGAGHGTFTAGIAAGSEDGHAGGAPNAKIVELDVLDDQGAGTTSDMIAACDWILANKNQYGIRVVNISVVGSQSSSFVYDPLDKAVERLWLNGVVVVTAAGNYGSAAAASGVPVAPANDPFVITVGAADTNSTASIGDDFAAPWSAWGYTNDGFFKPELAAPGRYLNGPVPSGATMPQLFPARQVAPGYMWMSGTSFAAPVVAAAADYLLAMHPDWTPDQVKGALMVTSSDPTGYTGAGGLGVGEVQADVAATLADGVANPNVNLDRFVTVDPVTGLNQFDSGSWQTAATINPAWNTMSWASMSWASQSWASQSWASQSWASQSWASQSWASQSWASMSWASMSWSSQSWASANGAP